MQFNLVIRNPVLTGDDYIPLASNYLQQTLQTQFYFPNLVNKPWIFSCFASSVDGKLCYPDLASGYAIAQNNFQALSIEREADWWNLSLGRALADVVLIGSNSLALEGGNYVANVDIPPLVELRQQLNKAKFPWHLVVCRDSQQINWDQQLVVTDPDLPLIIYSQTITTNLPSNIVVVSKFNPDCSKQLILASQLNIVDLVGQLYQAGLTTILNESPYYHHYLQQYNLLDEVWLNTSTIYIGGDGASLGKLNQAFSSTQHPHYTILTLHHIGYNFLYTRYKIS
ncbi:MAG: hypothetical protein RLZZ293_1222 [Pseudomonadota bacterium]|jgi:riboflavin biosynthesis pyrimidine reductase